MKKIVKQNQVHIHLIHFFLEHNKIKKKRIHFIYKYCTYQKIYIYYIKYDRLF